MRDIVDNIGLRSAIDAAAARTASVNGNSIDLLGFESVAVAFFPATVTDGSHTPKLQDSPDGTTWTDVPAGSMIGTLTALVSNTPQKVGYVGINRYLRAVVTSSGATTGAVYSATAILGGASAKPVA